MAASCCEMRERSSTVASPEVRCKAREPSMMKAVTVAEKIPAYRSIHVLLIYATKTTLTKSRRPSIPSRHLSMRALSAFSASILYRDHTFPLVPVSSSIVAISYRTTVKF